MADNLSAGFLSRLRNLTEAQLVDLCFKMAERHNDTFVEIVLAIPEREALPVAERTSDYDFVSCGQTHHVTFTGPQMVELRRLATPDQKVSCIKKVREFTGLGLKEAKDFVEETFIKQV